MASLTSILKTKHYPSIPGNEDLPEAERFSLVISSGVPLLRMRQLLDDARGGAFDTPDGAAAALAGLVELGPVPLTLDGEPVPTLEAYIRAIQGQAGQPLLDELLNRVREVNSLEGARVVFSKRQSGGSDSTRDQTA